MRDTDASRCDSPFAKVRHAFSAMQLRRATIAVLTLLVLQAGPLHETARGQSPAPGASNTLASELIELNFPGEIEVKTFADYVSERLKISILYDESIRGKRITVRSAQPIPVTSLLSLLQSTLRVKNLNNSTPESECRFKLVS